MSTQWFQQDRASPHSARETRRLLKQKFDTRFIYLYEDVE